MLSCLLLTGKLPFQATTNEQYAQAHLYSEPRVPSQLLPSRFTASDIDAILFRALEKLPERRYPSVLAFAYELQRALIHMTRTQAGAITEIGEGSVQLLPETHPVLAQATSQLSGREAELVIAIEPLERVEERILDEPLPVRPPRDVVVPETIEVMSLLHPPLERLLRRELPARPRSLCWSPDGSCLACVLYGHKVLYFCKEGVLCEVQTANTKEATCACWSPDGRVLAVGSQGEIRFWDIFLREELPRAIRLGTRPIQAMDWSSRGHLAVWVEDRILLYALPSSLLTMQQAVAPHILSVGEMRPGTGGVLRWSFDGERLAAGASNGRVVCWYMEARGVQMVREEMWQVVSPGQKVNSLAWSPDATLLVVAFRNHRLVGWNPLTGQRVVQWDNLPVMPRMLSVSRAHRIVIASSQKKLLCGVVDEPAPSLVLPGQLLAAWSPTALELATLDELQEKTLMLWREPNVSS